MGVISQMRFISVLLKRAQQWPVTPVNVNDITDPVSRGLLDMSVCLRAEDIITPEEVAARLKVPESWAYEKTRARCRNPIPCLRLGRYIRFDWNTVVNWLTVEAEKSSNAKRPGLQKKR